ncbi:MAG: sigma 54-interacting transcriptional regulator, partial [Deltaproteobacteria bacterium]|nr:sigma 54-interacting transcriptional regulator [Deltaproteobacteria bacterium]
MGKVHHATAPSGDPAFREYIQKGVERGIESRIVDSWKRCSQAGLSPFVRTAPAPIENHIFKQRIEQNLEIVELFQFYMRRFSGMLEQLGACSFVCDIDGYILSRVGYGKALNFFDNVSLLEGSNCSEEFLGTNAPGLALVTREPVMVTADEHYAKICHPAFCAASPILDQNRDLLGCVDITKFFDHHISDELRNHLLNLAISLSDMIRNEVFLGRLARSYPVHYPGRFESQGGPNAPGSGDRPERKPRFSFARIVGSAPPLARAVQTAKTYGRKEGNVLILGETGTGKELFAQAIHDEGRRAGGPFVTVNCAAIPLELAESELFGYERGAFTGARTEGHPGKFEMAHQGTIFLDEINSMPLPIQAKILRVVETKRVTRINGKREIPVDVRIIAASNRVLADEVAAGTFRKDLFYRLNVLPLRVPALREMKEDIPALLDAFFHSCAEAHGVCRKRISTDAQRRLVAYDWPGNVRELKNCAEYLCFTVEGDEVAEHHLPPEIHAGKTDGAPGPAAPPEEPKNLGSLER